MSLQFDAEPVFAAHQTFHPRFGWLKKAYDSAASNPHMFNNEEATVALGVGKNMVDAIRFWGQAFKVISKSPQPGKGRATLSHPTNLGKILFDNEAGLDPFAENPATLWLLHWVAASRGSLLPVWRIFFSEYSAVEFTIDEFSVFAEEQIAGTPWRMPVQASIEKDIDCIVRMYCTRAARGRQTLDDLMDSPFRQLGLIVSSPAGPDSYRFVIGDKPFLSDWVIVYCALDYIAMNDASSKTVTTTRLSADSGSPGRLLKISEARLLQAIENVSEEIEGINVASPAGASQLLIKGNLQEIAGKILLKQFRSTKGMTRRIVIPAIGPAAREVNMESFEKTRKIKAS